MGRLGLPGMGLRGRGQATWLPPRLTGNILWLRADMGITLNGSDVAAWADQSGEGNDATQGVAADQPAFDATGGPNGRPCVTFDAAGTEFLDLAAMTDASHDYTVFAVFDQTATAGTQTLLGSAAAALVSVAHTAALALNDGTAWRDVVAAKTGGQIATWLLDASGATVDVYRDGTLLGSGTYDATWSWAAPELGKTPAGTDYLDAKLAELIVYNRALTDAEVALVHAYLSARYAISFDLKTSIGGGCVCWLEADVGAAVDLWEDQTANGNDIAQAAGAKQPTIQATAGPNSTPCYRFDGIDDALEGVWTENQATQTFLICNMTIGGGSDNCVMDGDGVNTMGLWWDLSGPNAARMVAGANLTWSAQIAAGAWHYFSLLFDGVTSAINVDGGTPVVGDVGGNNSGGLTLGTQGDGVGRPSDCEIAAVYVFPAALTAEEEALMEAHFSSRYGL